MVPRRQVRIDRPIAMSRHEVTIAQFTRLADAAGYAPPRGYWQFVGAD
jgi:formylglycine-generating enzyme required for sulfatase activity